MKSKSKFQVFLSRWDRKANPFACFLGKVTAQQFCFKIYWPLESLQDLNFKLCIQSWYWTFYKSPPFEFWWINRNQKNQRGDPCKMSNTEFVQTSSNFAQLSKIRKLTSSQNLKSLTQWTKNQGNNALSTRFGKYSFQYAFI